MDRSSGALAAFRFDAAIGMVVSLVLFTMLVEGGTADVHALRIGLAVATGGVFALVCFFRPSAGRSVQ